MNTETQQPDTQTIQRPKAVRLYSRHKSPSDPAHLATINRPEPLGRPSKELANACHAIKLKGLSQKIFNQHANLRTSTYKLVQYLTKYWPDPDSPGAPLLDRCLYEAFNECGALYDANNGDVDAVILQKAYVTKIVDVMGESLRTSLMINMKSIWIPHEVNGDYLEQTIRLNKVTNLTWTLRDAPEVSGLSKLVLGSRVFTLNELEMAGLLG
jgi:hypothetical protein